MSIHGVLGETTNYPKTYDPSVLYPIARSLGRDVIFNKTGISADLLTIGVDWWHCFELSWLSPLGISQVAMMRLEIPANSEFIIESKSLKLYLNSLNLTEFESMLSVKNSIENDLSSVLQTEVKAELFQLNESSVLPIESVKGVCIDNALDSINRKIIVVNDVDASLLKPAVESNNDIIYQTYHSHLLRSNCPVTDQPDWGTLQIDIDSEKIDEASLLEYILTYRQHNGFHEQCVEQIFADLSQRFKPKKIMVRAWYTRRGGIDINPCRFSSLELIANPSRLVRQ